MTRLRLFSGCSRRLWTITTADGNIPRPSFAHLWAWGKSRGLNVERELRLHDVQRRPREYNGGQFTSGHRACSQYRQCQRTLAAAMPDRNNTAVSTPRATRTNPELLSPPRARGHKSAREDTSKFRSCPPRMFSLTSTGTEPQKSSDTGVLRASSCTSANVQVCFSHCFVLL